MADELLFSDDFDRANNADMGADWTVLTSAEAWKINANTAEEPNSGNFCAEYVSSLTPADDQYAEGDLVTGIESLDDTAGHGVGVRFSASQQSAYIGYANSVSTGEIRLKKHVNAAITELGQYTAGSAPVFTDRLRVEAVGDTIRMFHKTAAGSFIERVSVTDSALTFGHFGVAGRANNEVGGLDNFTGGNIVADGPEHIYRNNRSSVPPNVRIG